MERRGNSGRGVFASIINRRNSERKENDLAEKPMFLAKADPFRRGLMRHAFRKAEKLSTL